MTSYDNLFVKANEIHLALIKGEPLSIIQAFIDQKDKAFINSEGANAGNSLRKALNDAGIASGYDYSFRIYASKSDNNYTITISERKVTLEDIKREIKSRLSSMIIPEIMDLAEHHVLKQQMPPLSLEKTPEVHRTITLH